MTRAAPRILWSRRVRVRGATAALVATALSMRIVGEVEAAAPGFGGVALARPSWFTAPQAPARVGSFVHVDGPPEVELVEIVGADGRAPRDPILLRSVCSGRCDVLVDASRRSRFFFELAGRRSRPFHMQLEAGHVFVTVRPRRPALRVGGFVIAALGAAALVGGAVALAQTSDARSEKSARTGGGAMIGLGVATLTGGLVMFALGRMRAIFHDEVRRP